MNSSRILIVEDERIVARDLRDSLEGLGYEVVDIVSTGEKAIESAGSSGADLVLMDIILKGGVDGVSASREIRNRYDIPVVYLTAHTDIKTVDRVKETEPYGYVVKPFRIGELRSVIEIAIHKHRNERLLREESESISSVLGVMGSAIVTVDRGGVVRYMNRRAEEITGLNRGDVAGLDLSEVIRLKGGLAGDFGEVVDTAIEEGSGFARYEDVSIGVSDGSRQRMDLHVMRLDGTGGEVKGVALLFTEKISYDNGSVNLLSGYGIDEGGERVGLAVAGSSLVREGVKGVLGKVEGVDVVAEAGSRDELNRIVREGRADVLIVDGIVYGEELPDVLDELSESGGEKKIILLVNDSDERIIRDCIARGVNGFIRADSVDKIPGVLFMVYKGKFWIDSDIFTELLGNNQQEIAMGLSGSINLTRKEREVMELAVNGYSNKQISKELYISPNTVKTHMKKIFSKLGIQKRSELILLG